MSTVKTLLYLSITLLLTSASQAQTADEIIAKYISALGGREKLQSVHSVYMEGVSVLQNGMEINSKIWKVQGKLYRQEIAFGMGNVIVIVTPTQGWSQNPRTAGKFVALTPEQLKAMQPQMDPVSPLVDYASKGSKVEVLGKDTVNGNECDRLKLTFASGESATYSIDMKTAYILREVRKAGPGMMGGGGAGGQGGGAGAGNGGRGAGGEFKIEYSDYQKTPDGYIFPFTILASGFGAKTIIEKLEVNKPVDEAALSKPN